jgi:CCR4-NOT transcription complex subunit 2
MCVCVCIILNRYQREWRYHREERVWITRAPFSHTPQEQRQTYERGTYHVFDPSRWTKVPKEMTLEYSKLEDKPPLFNQAANGLLSLFVSYLFSV